MYPYLLFGQRELRNLQERVEPTVAEWHEHWFGTHTIAVTCSQLAAKPDGDTWWHAKPDTGLGLYIKKQPGLIKSTILAAFGEVASSSALSDSPSPIVAACITELIVDLSNKILRAIGVTTDGGNTRLVEQAPDDACLATASGTVQLHLSASGLDIRLLIPGVHAAALLRSKPIEKSAAASSPLADPMPMLQKHSVKLTAVLGKAELEIGILRGIAVGDVIRFDTRIDQPARLMTSDGTHIASGYLGCRGPIKSLQITN